MNHIYGLVVCGGKSSRMGRDKSLLQYHAKPQRYHLYELMQPFCERVFISCNSSQAPDIPSEYEVLVDDPEYGEIGPMAALLTAFRNYPEASFMVAGCDYPLITNVHLQAISKVLLHTQNTAAYYNNTSQLYEPLLAGYQSNISKILSNYFKLNQLSLQTVLKQISAGIIVPDDDSTIRSIDTIDEYEKAFIQLYNSNFTNAKL